MNNRQNGRRRGRGGQQPRGGGQGPHSNSRLDNRQRGNAAQLLEKYKTLARDAQMQGDRVNTEYYLQFADHYFRVLSENRSRFEEQRRTQGGDGQDYGSEDENEPQRGYNQRDFADDWDDEDGGEPETVREQPARAAGRERGDQPRDGQRETQAQPRGDGQPQGRGEGQRRFRERRPDIQPRANGANGADAAHAPAEAAPPPPSPPSPRASSSTACPRRSSPPRPSRWSAWKAPRSSPAKWAARRPPPSAAARASPRPHPTPPPSRRDLTGAGVRPMGDGSDPIAG